MTVHFIPQSEREQQISYGLRTELLNTDLQIGLFLSHVTDRYPPVSQYITI